MPSSIASVRSATASSSARSWETSRTVPGNASSAASSASRLSRSRWFVGSSSRRKFAPEATTSASASRRRSPPESADDGLLVLVPAGEEEPPEQVLRLRALEPGPRLDAAARTVPRSRRARPRAARSTRPRRRGRAGASRRRARVAEQRLEERRLARAVRADQRDVLAALEREDDVASSVLVARRELDAFDLDHGPPASRRLQELEAEALRAARQQVDLAASPRALLLAAGRSASASPAPAWPCSSCSGSARRSARGAAMSTAIRSAVFCACCSARGLLEPPGVPGPAK